MNLNEILACIKRYKPYALDAIPGVILGNYLAAISEDSFITPYNLATTILLGGATSLCGYLDRRSKKLEDQSILEDRDRRKLRIELISRDIVLTKDQIA